MLTKKQIFQKTTNESYKYAFLLAWCNFLTYDELQLTDNIEVFDSAIRNNSVKNEKDYNKKVIQYTKDNVLAAFHIFLSSVFNKLSLYNNINEISYVYMSTMMDDVKIWLSILENKTFKISPINKINENYKQSIDTLINIANFYKFEIPSNINKFIDNAKS